MTSFLEKLFNLLETNKEFPNYQAERRIDIFINLFLSDLLTEYKSEPVDYICPEFPLRKKGKYNLSTKLDYLCKTKDKLLFVELKTDSRSFKLNQLDCYFSFKTWGDCVRQFNKILPKIKSDQIKYQTLHAKLDSLDLRSKASEHHGIEIIYISPELSNKQLQELDGAGYCIKSVKDIMDLEKGITQYKEEWFQFKPFLIKMNLKIFRVAKT